MTDSDISTPAAFAGNSANHPKKSSVVDNEITGRKMVRMVAANFWRALLGAALIFSPTGLCAENKADQANGEISIVETRDEKIETLGNTGEISAKREVIAYVFADKPCEMFIAVFNRNGRRLAHGWKPQWVSVKEWHEQTVTLGSYLNPADPQQRKAVEVWTLFIAPQPADKKGSADPARKVQSLKAAFQDVIQTNAKEAAKREDKLLRKLENFLDDDPQARRPKLEPLRKAGEFLSAPVPWRDGAAKANFSPQRPGLIIIPSEPPEPAPPVSR